MEKTLKEVNDAVVEYTMTNTRNFVDFNTKLVNDYVEFNKSLIKMIPGLDVWNSYNTKR